MLPCIRHVLGFTDAGVARLLTVHDACWIPADYSFSLLPLLMDNLRGTRRTESIVQVWILVFSLINIYLSLNLVVSLHAEVRRERQMQNLDLTMQNSAPDRPSITSIRLK